jgi:Tfp pilus assembly protein PilX
MFMIQPVARSMHRLHAQRGVGALVVMLLLLFGASIIVFYLNRGLIFEQKASANQVRSTTAFEVAEAGIEWATGRLNTPYDIDTGCALLATANVSFRSKYLPVSGSAFNAATTTYPGCKISGTTLTCSCPNVPSVGNEAVASLGTASLPSFTVAFENVVGDSTAVRVVSTGCTAQAGACKPLTGLSAATTGNSDAWAQVSVVLKVRSLIRAAPSAALTCGTSCQPGGSYNVINTDVASNGYLVNAGTSITTGSGVTYTTIPGQPVQNALIANDTSLSAVANSDPSCSNSAMMSTFLGTTMAEYAASPLVRTITCSSANDCGSQANTAMNEGWRNFYFPSGFALNNSAPFSAMGAPGAGNGVTIVSPGDIDINGNISIYGLIFSNSANFNDLGTGTADIYGAIITCAAQRSNGNGTIQYDANALGGTGPRPGPMVRVPGSWRDFTP